MSILPTVDKEKFKYYKSAVDKVIDLLIKEKCASLNDITIVFKLILGLPFCMDQEGHYSYEGEYYETIHDLPNEAFLEILEEYKDMYKRHKIL